MNLDDDDSVAWILRPGCLQVSAASILELLRSTGRSVLALTCEGEGGKLRMREAAADDVLELAERVNRDLGKFGVRCEVDPNTSDGLVYHFHGVRLP